MAKVVSVLQRLTGTQYSEGTEHFCFHNGNKSCNEHGYFSHSFDIDTLRRWKKGTE